MDGLGQRLQALELRDNALDDRANALDAAIDHHQAQQRADLRELQEIQLQLLALNPVAEQQAQDLERRQTRAHEHRITRGG